MNVALVGCRAVDTWPSDPHARDPRPWEADDRPLHAALEGWGARVHTPAWDDPAVDWSAYDVALIRTTWDYHLRRDAFVAWAEAVEARTVLLNPARVVRWNTHKSYLRDLEARGVPVIPTIWLPAGQPPEVARRLAEAGWSRGFLKPAVGATAHGTLRFEAGALARAEAHAAALVRADEALLQPYLAAVETMGERSAIVIDGVVTHWVRKIPVPGDYRVQDDHGASDVRHAPTPEERALVERTLEALGETLAYARVDWLLDDRGRPLLTELEAVEPSLFLRHGPEAADALADAIFARRR